MLVCIKLDNIYVLYIQIYNILIFNNIVVLVLEEMKTTSVYATCSFNFSFQLIFKVHIKLLTIFQKLKKIMQGVKIYLCILVMNHKSLGGTL